MKSKAASVTETLFFLLWMGVTGEGGELTWSNAANLCLQAAERLHGLSSTQRLSRQQALRVIDTAVALAASAGI